MLFIIRFTDNPGSRELRERNLAAHIAWLGERRDSILVAGSLRQETGADPIGALWVVEAADKDAAARVFDSDPFWTCGMRRNVEICHWSKAFPDERTPV